VACSQSHALKRSRVTTGQSLQQLSLSVLVTPRRNTCSGSAASYSTSPSRSWSKPRGAPQTGALVEMRTPNESSKLPCVERGSLQTSTVFSYSASSTWVASSLNFWSVASRMLASSISFNGETCVSSSTKSHLTVTTSLLTLSTASVTSSTRASLHVSGSPCVSTSCMIVTVGAFCSSSFKIIRVLCCGSLPLNHRRKHLCALCMGSLLLNLKQKHLNGGSLLLNLPRLAAGAFRSTTGNAPLRAAAGACCSTSRPCTTTCGPPRPLTVR
jgi:hypothetical protein